MRVSVTEAPGFGDFEGELLMDVLSVDGRRLAVVGTEVDGKRDFEMVPYDCVQEIDDP